MTALVYSSSLAAAFLGGVLALFAPCCIVSLMPAYLAAALRRGPWRLIRLTGLFTVGVAAVLLPVVLGIGALSQLLGTYHREVYFVVGLLLALLGFLSLSGQGWMLPIPTFQTRAGLGRGDAASVLFLGMISGVASSCCAPVLVGVLALTALSPSVLSALGLGLAYVFGMVFPLLVAAILWERLELDPGVISRLGAHRLKVGEWSPKVTDVIGGIIFLAMGTIALYIAYTGQSTFTPDFMLAFNQWATGIVANLVQALGVIPPVVQGIVLLLIAGLVFWLGWGRPADPVSLSEGPSDLADGRAVPDPGRGLRPAGRARRAGSGGAIRRPLGRVPGDDAAASSRAAESAGPNARGDSAPVSRDLSRYRRRGHPRSVYRPGKGGDR